MEYVKKTIEEVSGGIRNIMELTDIVGKNCEFGAGLPKKVLVAIVEDHVSEIMIVCWHLERVLSEMQAQVNSTNKYKIGNDDRGHKS